MPQHRDVAIDTVKGTACLLIVAHHLVVYSPMADAAGGLAPGVVSWLFDYGRWVVQVFLVIGGYLSAASLGPKHRQALQAQPASQPRASAAALIWRRYCRLFRPYAVAVAASVGVAALTRPWFSHPSVPDAPSLAQVLVHATLLHDVLGFQALSAGIWYVAIDFQLYALGVLVFSAAAAATRRWPGQLVLRGDSAMLAIGLASLWAFNRDPSLDVTALYFVGAYVLGMVAYWAAPNAHHGADKATHRAHRWWLAVLFAMGCTALLVAFRGRVALAWATALGLVVLRHGVQRMAHQADGTPPTLLLKPSSPRGVRWLASVGVMSYSVFLIHFPVCLLVSAVMARVWPVGAWANLLGLGVAVALSLAAGRALYHWVELPPAARRARQLG